MHKERNVTGWIVQATLRSERCSPCLARAGDEFHLACVIIDETDDLRPYYRERPLVRCHAGCATCQCVYAGQLEAALISGAMKCNASSHAGVMQKSSV